jgi:hypothetical protein
VAVDHPTAPACGKPGGDRTWRHHHRPGWHARGPARAKSQRRRDKLNDLGMEGEADVVFWGQVHPFLKWQAGFVGAFGPQTGAASAALLDLVAKLEFAESVQSVARPHAHPFRSRQPQHGVGHRALDPARQVQTPLPPSRPTARPTPGPRMGDNDRGDGATLWGQLGGGTFKYYLGVFGLDQPGHQPALLRAACLSLLARTRLPFEQHLLRQQGCSRLGSGRSIAPATRDRPRVRVTRPGERLQ